MQGQALVQTATRGVAPALDLAPGCKVYRGWVRISELAESAGVPASTVRYYERVGLMGLPDRTASGYRNYGEDAAAQLLFITRARRMGLSCEQIAALIPAWAGTNCSAARDRVARADRGEAGRDRRPGRRPRAVLSPARHGARHPRRGIPSAGMPGGPHLLRPAVGGRAGRHRAQAAPLSPLPFRARVFVTL